MTLNFHLGELLLLRYRQLGENWKNVSADIKLRVPDRDHKGKTIDRRKLKKIAAGADREPLTIFQMRVLQTYLVAVGLLKFDENPIFRQPGSLIDVLRGQDRLAVFYTSRFLRDYETEGASVWDVEAIAALNTAPEIRALRFSFRSVFNLGRNFGDLQTRRESHVSKSWRQELDGDRALLSIGAPYACYASEELLARIFNLTPYAPFGFDKENRLPFYLYWPREKGTSDSAFTITALELQQHFPEQFERMGADSRGVLIGNELYPAPRVGETMNLVISQYRGGHPIVVILGIYAPGTLAMAQLFANRQIPESLGPYQYTEAGPDEKVEAQPILISKIRTTITVTSDENEQSGPERRDVRKPAGAEPVGWERWQWGGERFEMIESGSPAPESPAA